MLRPRVVTVTLVLNQILVFSFDGTILTEDTGVLR